MEKILNDMMVTILSYNSDLLMLALSNRAKFEGWLKFELANILSRTYPETKVEQSATFNKSNVHVDIYSNKSWIELKTPNTSYKSDACAELIRPVTNNVSSILHDIDKLHGIEQASIVESIIQIKNIPVLVFTAKVV